MTLGPKFRRNAEMVRGSRVGLVVMPGSTLFKLTRKNETDFVGSADFIAFH